MSLEKIEFLRFAGVSFRRYLTPVLFFRHLKKLQCAPIRAIFSQNQSFISYIIIPISLMARLLETGKCSQKAAFTVMQRLRRVTQISTQIHASAILTQ